MRSGIQGDLLAGERRIGAVGTFPELITKHYPAVTARAVFGSEQSAGSGHHSGRGKDFGRNDGGTNALRIADVRAGSGVAPWMPHYYFGEGGSAILFPIAKVWH